MDTKPDLPTDSYTNEGFTIENAPPAPDMRNFPYPVKDYGLLIENNHAKLTITLEIPADISIIYGKKNTKQGTPQHIERKNTSTIENITIPLVDGSNFIDMTFENDQFKFTTIVTIDNGVIYNNLALYSAHYFFEKLVSLLWLL